MAAAAPVSTRVVTGCLGAIAGAEVLAAIGLTLAVGWSWGQALDAFVVTNALMGASFAASGVLVSWHRPGNVVGWLLLADGLGHATSAWLPPLVQRLHDGSTAPGLQRLAVTVFGAAWPWSIALFLPLALLLFPDGRLPGPRWRWAAWAIGLTAPLFVLEAAADPGSAMAGFPRSYLAISSYDSLGPLWAVSEVRTLAALALAVTALVVRYRVAGEADRRRLLWLLLAGVAMVAGVLPWSFVAGTPVFVLFAIPLVPAAVCVAVLRHQLLDIRVVVSRALSWVLLSALVVVAYVALVALLDTLVSRTLGRSVLTTVLVAVGLAPLLPRLQRAVDRRLYGERRNPAGLASGMARHLAAMDEEGLSGVVTGLKTGLRLPYVGLSTHSGRVVRRGDATGAVEQLALLVGTEQVGILEVGLRSGEHELSAADLAVLQLVTAPLAVTIHALDLTADLQASRGRIVLAREEERRRLRRDLHDGLGPTLTGMALAADAVANQLGPPQPDAQALVDSLRRDSRVALAEVRRIVEDLRPAALDQLGLLDALRQRAGQLAHRADGSALDVRMLAPERLPALPAAVEVAAYRIATEALTNVARHADASGAVLTVRCAEALELEVTDDGATPDWRPGVGLQAMAERAAEVGARFEAGPSNAGGRVFVAIPLEPA